MLDALPPAFIGHTPTVPPEFDETPAGFYKFTNRFSGIGILLSMPPLVKLRRPTRVKRRVKYATVERFHFEFLVQFPNVNMGVGVYRFVYVVSDEFTPPLFEFCIPGTGVNNPPLNMVKYDIPDHFRREGPPPYPSWFSIWLFAANIVKVNRVTLPRR